MRPLGTSKSLLSFSGGFFVVSAMAFCGQAVVFGVGVHGRGGFCGQAVVFEANVHGRGGFCG